jgi:cytochrome c-type biogenesis protein CcmE
MAMNKIRQKKLLGILSILLIVSMAVGLILYALKQNINLFYTPTQLLQSQVTPTQVIRLGGYVKDHSVHYKLSGQEITFVITDHLHDLEVTYAGVLPNLFREGQGVVITGTLLPNHLFHANEVLAKHDEKYMPWPIAKKLAAQIKDEP